MYFEDANKLMNNNVKSLWYSMEMKDGLAYCQLKQVVNESTFAMSLALCAAYLFKLERSPVITRCAMWA